MPLALPHGDAEFVKSSALAIGKCAEPIPFHSMSEPDKILPARLVVMLAVGDPDGHLEILSHLMDALADEAFCREVLEADSGTAIASLFAAKVR